MSRALAWTAAVGVALLMTGCAGPGSEEATRTAVDFEASVRPDPRASCDLLGPGPQGVLTQQGQDCASALAQAGLPVGARVLGTDVYGHQARVVLDRDTVFLARYDGGWRVTAAGCSPPDPGDGPDAPYDCLVSGS